MPSQNPAPHQVRQSTIEITKTTRPTTIRTTPITLTSTELEVEFTAQVRIAPKAIRIKLMMIPIARFLSPRADYRTMRLGGFEPPTNGLEGRRSSTELQARSRKGTSAKSQRSGDFAEPNGLEGR